MKGVCKCMNKFLKVISSVVLCAVITAPSLASAASSEVNTAKLISEESIKLTTMNQTTRNIESKEFNLKTFDDNGVKVYSFDVEDPMYRESAMEYINELTGDLGKNKIQTRKPLLPGESEYHNDTGYDGSAMSYAWKENTANNGNNFVGGQSSSWNGSGNASQIVLNQGISVSGLGVTISWPPGVSGSGSSGSWQSQPISGNIAGASFTGMKVSSLALSVTFSEFGDVYVGSRVYRPGTYIKFSLIS